MSDILDQLILSLASLPGIGPKSAQKIALHLVADQQGRIIPFVKRLADAATKLNLCRGCGMLDDANPCWICEAEDRDPGMICVVAGMADVTAMERGGYQGKYHVLGGLLSAINGIGPKNLRIGELVERALALPAEVILALPVTVDGSTTASLVKGRLLAAGVKKISQLLPGIPVGSGIDDLSDNTITAALKMRQPIEVRHDKRNLRTENQLRTDHPCNQVSGAGRAV